MIKAIIFDCFGVLASDGWLPYRDRHFGHDTALFEKAMVLNRAVDAGKLDYDDFIAGVAELAGVDENEARTEIENNIPNDEMFTYISSELSSKYKVGMLSNAAANWLDEIFQPEQVAVFDEIALSFETSFIKPEPEAYQIIIARLGLSAEECIFIDDQPKYCDGAVAAGMHVIPYQSVSQTKASVAAIIAENT